MDTSPTPPLPTTSELQEGTESGKTSIADLAALFLRLGATAFGGPAAHIAMMRDEVVHRRKWLTDEQFLDLLSAQISFRDRTRQRWRFTSGGGAVAGRVSWSPA